MPGTYKTVVVLLLCCASACSAVESPLGNLRQPIYHGTREPQVTTLSTEEVLAIGWLYWLDDSSSNYCTATLIAPRVVATAGHCFDPGDLPSYVSFGVGLYPEMPEATFRVAKIHIHRYVDAALLLLQEDAAARHPYPKPIPISREAPDLLIGQVLETAGYGETHDGSKGRYFARVYFEQLKTWSLMVNGRGQQGLCFGDSGAPLLAPGPRVLAVEAEGDDSCVGEDEMTRLDILADWIEAMVNRSPAAHPCQDLSYLGRCDGNVAEWCDNGRFMQYDCSWEGKGCGYIDGEYGYYCLDEPPRNPCGTLDQLGRCSGTVAEWCHYGEFRQYDCAWEGRTCGKLGEQLGFYCTGRSWPVPGPHVFGSGGCNTLPSAARCSLSWLFLAGLMWLCRSRLRSRRRSEKEWS